MSTHTARYAGISTVKNGSGSKTLRFHTTGANAKVGLWVELPCKASFKFIKLPRAMNKLNAARYLLSHHAFQTSEVQKMLRRHVEHRERGITINPRTPPAPRRSKPKQHPVMVPAIAA